MAQSQSSLDGCSFKKFQKSAYNQNCVPILKQLQSSLDGCIYQGRHWHLTSVQSVHWKQETEKTAKSRKEEEEEKNIFRRWDVSQNKDALNLKWCSLAFLSFIKRTYWFSRITESKNPRLTFLLLYDTAENWCDIWNVFFKLKQNK